MWRCGLIYVAQDRVPLRDLVNMLMRFRVLVKRFLIFFDQMHVSYHEPPKRILAQLT
jgi:hypothetical protein